MSAGRSFWISLGGNLLGLLLFALLTPVYLRAIGPERYGIVAVILSLSMYISTFNFGMGPALTYHIAGTLNGKIAAQSDAYWSAMALSAPLGLIASVLIFGLLPIGLANVMHLSASARIELRGAITPLVGIGLCTILTANIRGTWNGRRAFLTLAGFSSIETAFTILLPVVTALYVSNEISALLYATFAARISLLAGGMALCSARMFNYRLPRVSLTQLRLMTRYGSWVTLGTFVETIVSSADRLILGTLGGAVQIPVYSIPLSITSRAMIIPLNLLSTMFPNMVGADEDAGKALLSKITRFILLLTPGYVVVIALASPLLRYWISVDFSEQASLCMEFLAAALWIEGVSAIYFYQLNARGDARANFLIALGIVLPYLGMLALGTWLAGASGVAAAYLARNILILLARLWLAKIRGADLRIVAANAMPVAAALLFAAHGWAAFTTPSIVLGVAVMVLSIGVSLWTRPDELSQIASRIWTGRSRIVGKTR
ncbi:oligosaccharide flippase family protein [Sphingomonas psychrolutea]|uniref:Polysaccharide biosynthesis protein C-terminal domain-containing protein n=1 Tax=Sphingomonas psychrolutea TaxID=1259676 RepID=A0ABQ1FYQ3_9SPHN|nr:oligosaccharide flippase family protein [Sphingomonas psychrolutea]GGA34071.1 hypothetical protein GCM10011395_00460 [Sphingomonas psychrolutea]